MDIAAALAALGLAPQYAAAFLAVAGFAAVVTKYVPPPPAAPATRLGRVWGVAYPVLNWLAQNGRHAANANAIGRK